MFNKARKTKIIYPCVTIRHFQGGVMVEKKGDADLFKKEKKSKQNTLLQYAGALRNTGANGGLEAILRDKNNKTLLHKL